MDGADRFAFPLPVLAADLAWPAIAMRQVSAPARVVTPGGAAVASLLAVAHAALPFVQGAPWEPVAGLVRFVAGRVRFAAALGWIVAFAAVVVLAGMTASTSGATFD